MAKAQEFIPRKQGSGNSLDNYPTPPWATRALIHHVLEHGEIEGELVLDPCVGAGHMAKILEQHSSKVHAVDVLDYGWPNTVVGDFLREYMDYPKYDWIIANPPIQTRRGIHTEVSGYGEIRLRLLPPADVPGERRSVQTAVRTVSARIHPRLHGTRADPERIP